MSANPQAAATGNEPTVVLPGNFIPQGRGVPMGNGWTWLADAWSIFRKAAGTWIGMVVVLAVIFIVAHFIPFIGAIAMQILWPVFVGGLMLASRSIDQGGEAQFSQLFAGFQHRTGALVVLGVIWLVLSIVIVAIVVGITGVQVFALMGAGGGADQIVAVALTALLAFLLILALMLPLGLVLLWMRRNTPIVTRVLGTLCIVILAIGYFYAFSAWRKSVGHEAQFTALEQHRAQQQAQAASATGQPAAPNAAPQATPGASPIANGQPASAGVAPETNAAHATRNYWTNFRGPNRDGRYEEMAVLTAWPSSGLAPIWKQPIGLGYGSFTVADGRAYTLEQRRKQLETRRTNIYLERASLTTISPSVNWWRDLITDDNGAFGLDRILSEARYAA